MSIYNDPVAYAKKTRIPVSLSRVWCVNQLDIQKEIDAARFCPKCGQPTLILEMGSYEEGTSDYVYCENDQIPAEDVDGEKYFEDCDYVAEPEKKHEPLSHWYDFDIIWALSGRVNSGYEQHETLQEWVRYVKYEVENSRLRASISEAAAV